MTTISVSRSITRHVRGLHLAVLTHNRTGRYHGNGMLIPLAVKLAQQGEYAKARRMLRVLRQNGQDALLMPVHAIREVKITPAAADLLSIPSHAVIKTTTKAITLHLNRAEATALRGEILRKTMGAKGNDLRALASAHKALDFQ